MPRDKVRPPALLSPLSQVSPWWAATVRSLQTPCQRAPQAGGDQAAWRQGAWGSNAHSEAAHRLDHWAAGTGAWGWLLPWGDVSRRMTWRQGEKMNVWNIKITDRYSFRQPGPHSELDRRKRKFRDLWFSCFLKCGLMWSGQIFDSTVNRKFTKSARLQVRFTPLQQVLVALASPQRMALVYFCTAKKKDERNVFSPETKWYWQEKSEHVQLN